MHVSFAVLSEHVIQGRDGKLSIIGIFDEIHSVKAPFTFPRVFTTIYVQGRISDGTDHVLRVVIVDEDGHEVVKKSPPLPIALTPRGPGVPMQASIVVDFREVHFPRFGDYELNVFIDQASTPAASIGFTVAQIERKIVHDEEG